jgi:hypothetical protein
MREVTIAPLPEMLRAPRFRKWRPSPAPIFAGYTTEPTGEELALARELFTLLDEESKGWYRQRFCYKEIFDGL